MKKSLVKSLIVALFLITGQQVFADVEGTVIVVTNVPYTASLTKKASTESASINPATGAHTGLSSVYTLQTNGGDDYFEYIISSYINIDEGKVSAFGNDGRLLFAHTTALPDFTSLYNAKNDSGQSKNIFAYQTNLVLTGGRSSIFQQNYKDYGNCYEIFASTVETGDVTFNVSGTPKGSTYEAGLDEAGTYKSTIVFTIASK